MNVFNVVWILYSSSYNSSSVNLDDLLRCLSWTSRAVRAWTRRENINIVALMMVRKLLVFLCVMKYSPQEQIEVSQAGSCYQRLATDKEHEGITHNIHIDFVTRNILCSINYIFDNLEQISLMLASLVLSLKLHTNSSCHILIFSL